MPFAHGPAGLWSSGVPRSPAEFAFAVSGFNNAVFADRSGLLGPHQSAMESVQQGKETVPSQHRPLGAAVRPSPHRHPR